MVYNCYLETQIGGEKLRKENALSVGRRRVLYLHVLLTFSK
jgi:hypothetical protein